MPIKDNRSNRVLEIVDVVDYLATSLAQETPAVDTADYDDGVSFILFPSMPILVNTCFITINSLSSSPDDITYTVLSENQLIGVEVIGVPIISQPPLNTVIPMIGVIGSDRYVKVNYDATVIGAPFMNVHFFVLKDGEIKPTSG